MSSLSLLLSVFRVGWYAASKSESSWDAVSFCWIVAYCPLSVEAAMRRREFCVVVISMAGGGMISSRVVVVSSVNSSTEGGDA